MTQVTDSGTRVLDAPSAVEFMREALVKISESEIAEVASQLEQRRDLLFPMLERVIDGRGSVGDLSTLWRGVFVTRRTATDLSASRTMESWAESLRELVKGQDDLPVRFSRFDAALHQHEESFRRDLAGEMLRLFDPDEYWLWSRWMWNEKTDTGSLPLVLAEGFDLSGDTAGEIYLKVGDATKVVIDTASEIGFAGMKANCYAVDVYLCAIYGIYLYTVTRMRMTQEFNRVIPKLPELVRRMLGVHRLEVGS